jgi:hypothetical protein
MRVKLPILCLTLILAACADHRKKPPENNTTKNTESTVNKEHLATPLTEPVMELLQGKWQHVEDTSNYLVFAGNKRKEIAGSMANWDEETFVLADKCLNEADKNNGEKPEKDQYISCPTADLCWYIIGVDEKKLILSYMARGNTLAYKRVK